MMPPSINSLGKKKDTDGNCCEKCAEGNPEEILEVVPEAGLLCLSVHG